ncbi:polysaccharide lyase family 7 protein [Lutibacter sp.]|uniref:polysaccharide lyase family 7 protein n=1 Tax=Lutibacter sp. TaxID=1925666 RepID=UPI001A26079C|nr:polysaccharide lyase family 7 protein [Lutibacter sp.]MBI9042105.1 polysaccharide lyase family 7 protein [Lutibacter sp.]
MKYILKISVIFFTIFSLTLQVSCQEKVVDDLTFFEDYQNENSDIQNNDNEDVFKLPNIDLNNWKVTLPIGKPIEVAPPEILNYATNETLKPFFYNDSIKGALVFYTYPDASTTNSSYSRTELREQLVPGSNSTNWTFEKGGTMKGTLEVAEMSKDASGNYYRTIVMQIHGILTKAQKELIGASDNNAPPMLKIYWVNGQVRVKTKVLKDLNATETEMLHEEAWGDDAGYTFPEYVGFDKFTLEVKVSNGKMEVILNEKASVVYESIHIQKWGIFENYFKAGNYFQSKDIESYSKVKYYELVVTH